MWYCKSTIFQANHNYDNVGQSLSDDVCDTAKVRFFKQITTAIQIDVSISWCLWYCKSTIFQANHNLWFCYAFSRCDVCDTAKVRFFKQITTITRALLGEGRMFVILQKYDFSSKSQPDLSGMEYPTDVCDTAKVRFFKQITTGKSRPISGNSMFVILQKYDFSSKSQPIS